MSDDFWVDKRPIWWRGHLIFFEDTLRVVLMKDFAADLYIVIWEFLNISLPDFYWEFFKAPIIEPKKISQLKEIDN